MSETPDPGVSPAAPTPRLRLPRIRLPGFTTIMAVGLFAMTWWLLYILSPDRGQLPSELFKMLAQAVVMTAFIGGPVAAAWTIGRDSQKKPETPATPSPPAL